MRKTAERENVAFKALVQNIAIKSLRTGDKSMRLTLEVDSPKDSLLTALMPMHKADEFVFVVIARGEK